MASTTPAPTPFAQWLRAQLEERDWGVRTLARRMNPAEPEVARRALNHYLRGSLPTDTYRALIAEGLGVPVAEVPAGAGTPEVAHIDPFPGGPGATRGGADGTTRRGGGRSGPHAATGNSRSAA